jgi:long-chain acyl-CoA synthetase
MNPSLALIDGRTGEAVSHFDLGRRIGGWVQYLHSDHRRQLVLIATQNTIPTVIAYRAALIANHAVMLMESTTPPPVLDKLLAAYRPDWLVLSADRAGPDGYKIFVEADGLYLWKRQEDGPDLHPSLALLLSTSGTTGSARFVRLSHMNLAMNTAAIISALGITATERAALHLPLSYSYGLSVLNTHLAAGGSVVLSDLGFMDPDFWAAVRMHRVTTLPGVPSHYHMLQRLGLGRLKLPDLSVLTQAGGRLDPDIAAALAADMQARSGKFFVMYGQTEAAPRMTVLPVHERPHKAGSVGRPVPGGDVTIEDGQIIYRGPNVMMGYAETGTDLAKGDALDGRLETGDIGFLDADGDLVLTGRTKRIAKIDGLRLSLAEVEKLSPAPAAALEQDGTLYVFTDGDAAAVKAALLSCLSLSPLRLDCRSIGQIPLTASGKLDYTALRGML